MMTTTTACLVAVVVVGVTTAPCNLTRRHDVLELGKLELGEMEWELEMGWRWRVCQALWRARCTRQRPDALVQSSGCVRCRWVAWPCAAPIRWHRTAPSRGQPQPPVCTPTHTALLPLHWACLVQPLALRCLVLGSVVLVVVRW